MRAAGLALAIGAWLIASSSPAPARADADAFAVEWIPAPEASSDTPVRIHDNHAVFGSRLLPKRLLITDADVIDGKGRLIQPVSPTPYREADPGTSKDYFTVYLRFEGWASSRKLSFSLC